jgi:predicted nucleic acid-binding protein
MGEIEVFRAATAVFEAIYILHRTLSIPRRAMIQALTELVSCPGLRPGDGSAIQNALAFWVEQPSLDFADCCHLALTKDLGMAAIHTFDRKMDRYPGVERIEP